MGILDYLEGSVKSGADAILSQAQRRVAAPVENAASNFVAGDTGWQKAAQNYLNAGFGNGIDALDSRFRSGQAVPTLQGPSQQYAQQHPVLGFLGSVGTGAVNFIPSVFNQAANIGTDASNEISAGGNAPYSRLLSPEGKLAGQALGAQGAPQDALSYAKNVAGTGAFASNFLLPGAAESGLAEESLVPQALKSAAATAKVGAGQGALSGFSDSPSASLAGSLADAGKGAVSGAVSGALLGGIDPLARGAFETGSAAVRDARDFDGLAKATHTYQAEPPATETSVVNGVPVNRPSELQTIRVSEPQADAILRQHDGIAPQVIDHLEPGPKVSITLDSDRNVVSWDPDEQSFAKEVVGSALRGQHFQSSQAGYVGNPGENVPGPAGKLNRKVVESIMSNPLLSDEAKASEIARETEAVPKNRPNILDTVQQARVNGAKEVPTGESRTGARPEPEPMDPAKVKAAADAALRNRSEIQQRLTSRGEAIGTYLDRNLPKGESRQFYEALEHPEVASRLIADSRDPKAFGESVARAKRSLEDAQDIRSLNGHAPLGSAYLPHDFDLSDPVAKEAYEGAARAKNFEAGSSKRRLFSDLNEAESYGLNQKESAGQVFRKYFQDQALQNGSEVLRSTMNELAPGHVSENGTVGRGPDGRPMRTVPARGFEGTTFSEEAMKHLNALKDSDLRDNAAVQAVSKASGIIKETKLGLSGFHALNVGLNDLAPEIMQGRFDTLPKALASMVSADYRNESLTDHIENGTVDWLSRSGATLSRGGGSSGEDTLFSKVRKLNPIERASNATFSGFINEIKFSLGDHYRGKGVDPSSEEGRRIGAAINNLLGGLNKDVLNRNKTVQQILQTGSISPDFTEGKGRLLAQALDVTRNDRASALARQSIIGKVVISAAVASIASRLVTGKWDASLKDFLEKRVLDPVISLPSRFDTPGSTVAKVAALPSNDLSDIYRLVTDPKHYFTARSGSLPSLVSSAANNQDYYGRQIYDPSDSAGRKALKVAETQLPIGANQAVALAKGKETPATAALDTIGLRVKTDPSDPAAVTMKARNDYQSTLSSDDLASWNKLHPPTTDAEGESLGSRDILSSAEKASIYLSHPEFLAQDTATAQKAGGAQDPFYALSPDRQKLVLAAAVKVPGQSNDYSAYLSSQPWYAAFTQQRNAFYDSLPAPTAPQPAGTVQLSPQLQSAVDGYDAAGTELQKKVYLAQHPEVSQYFDQSAAAKLTALGLPSVQSQKQAVLGQSQGQPVSGAGYVSLPSAGSAVTSAKGSSLKGTPVRSSRPRKAAKAPTYRPSRSKVSLAKAPRRSKISTSIRKPRGLTLRKGFRA